MANEAPPYGYWFISAMLAVEIGLSLLTFGQAIWLSIAGQEVRGTVAAVNYEKRPEGGGWVQQSYVKVDLPQPWNQQVDLWTWNGAPKPGDTVFVTVDRFNPSFARGANSFINGQQFATGCCTMPVTLVWWYGLRKMHQR